MARKEFLDYVWKRCIEPQLGYSFSLNHTLPYSLIALQEMNLATQWNPLYWQCACLCVNAGNYTDGLEELAEDADEDLDTDIETDTETETDDDSEDEEEEVKVKRVAPDYRKVAKAISDAQHKGVTIELPDINTAEVDFIPDVKNNSILYSLQTVSVVGTDLLNRIIEGRPYKKVEDFLEKVNPSPVQMLGLIKAGCFDSLYPNNTRLYIINRYLQLLADKEIVLKDKLTSVQIKKALQLNIQLPDFNEQVRMFKFKQYIDKNQFDKGTSRYILTEEPCIRFFNIFFKSKLNIAKSEYGDLPDQSIFVKKSSLTRVYEESIKPLMDFFNSDGGRLAYQQLLQEDFKKKLFDKYCLGTPSTWEMQTMCFYHSGHELRNADKQKYNIRNFFDLPENPNNTEFCNIVGTVIGNNNIRHTVSLLTPDGVVDVKFFRDTFVKFNARLSAVDPVTKKKTVFDEPWFKRGTNIICYGIRKENMFHARSTKVPVWTQGVGKIEGISQDGTLSIRYNRNKAK